MRRLCGADTRLNAEQGGRRIHSIGRDRGRIEGAGRILRKSRAGERSQLKLVDKHLKSIFKRSNRNNEISSVHFFYLVKLTN